ncbi:hypothetical protein QBC45DRAFT_132879 [Copromyces sp. CBS 386.78]|nr:hypothetical protein QBC45DRAFT_132879 [Copromyces sp. CBS 386.78]
MPCQKAQDRRPRPLPRNGKEQTNVSGLSMECSFQAKKANELPVGDNKTPPQAATACGGQARQYQNTAAQTQRAGAVHAEQRERGTKTRSRGQRVSPFHFGLAFEVEMMTSQGSPQSPYKIPCEPLPLWWIDPSMLGSSLAAILAGCQPSIEPPWPKPGRMLGVGWAFAGHLSDDDLLIEVSPVWGAVICLKDDEVRWDADADVAGGEGFQGFKGR